MATVCLIRPWRYQDQGVREHDLFQQWRNPPYSLVLLGTILQKHGHKVQIVDLERDLVVFKGDLGACMAGLRHQLASIRPDLVGVGFFSVHYVEVEKITQEVRAVARSKGFSPLLVAGGIHATVAPESVLAQEPDGLGFDCACLGEGELALCKLADGIKPSKVPGVATLEQPNPELAEIVEDLDSLPFPDWRLIDYAFYATPTVARMKFWQTSSLDSLMGRGCPFQCNFCAYGALSKVRIHSVEYLLEAMEHSLRYAPGVYFMDSSVGSWKKNLVLFCEEIQRRGLHKKAAWYANMRSDQVDRDLLHLLWNAGCRYLFYGFESGDQTLLDAMHKRNSVANNRNAALLHNDLLFPYNASFIVNYPGDTIESLNKTVAFLEEINPPSASVNWYVPLPGSTDYARLRSQGLLRENDPMAWRRIGEVNAEHFYAHADETAYRDLVAELEVLAYKTIPKRVASLWASGSGCVECNIADRPGKN